MTLGQECDKRIGGVAGFSRGPTSKLVWTAKYFSRERGRSPCHIGVFFADEIKFFSANVPPGVWTAFSIPLPPIAVTETFVAELGIRGTGKPFSENLIWVRRFEPGVFEPDRTQEPQGSEI